MFRHEIKTFKLAIKLITIKTIVNEAFSVRSPIQIIIKKTHSTSIFKDPNIAKHMSKNRGSL